MNDNVVQVELSSRSYTIHLTENSFGKNSPIWKQVLSDLQPIKHAFLVADENVAAIAVNPIRDCFEAAAIRVSHTMIASGESSKCVSTLVNIWEQLLASKTDRKSVVIAIGGGVVGDLAGFAAATFARGLRLIQVPTTLLAMVDSSVGGKTGINLPSAKNMIGAFWQPCGVVIDTSMLDSLPEREYLSGFAEVIKYGMIMDAEFFSRLEALVEPLRAREPAALREVIATCCRCKASVVSDDEFETSGRRAILNYGHTFAHAIEATQGYGALLHGEAVAVGMAMAAKLAVSLKMLERSSLDRQTALLQNIGLSQNLTKFDLRKLWPAMQSDKKVEQGKLGFILPRKIGLVERVEGITLQQLQDAIEI